MVNFSQSPIVHGYLESNIDSAIRILTIDGDIVKFYIENDLTFAKINGNSVTLPDYVKNINDYAILYSILGNSNVQVSLYIKSTKCSQEERNPSDLYVDEQNQTIILMTNEKQQLIHFKLIKNKVFISFLNKKTLLKSSISNFYELVEFLNTHNVEISHVLRIIPLYNNPIIANNIVYSKHMDSSCIEFSDNKFDNETDIYSWGICGFDTNFSSTICSGNFILISIEEDELYKNTEEDTEDEGFCRIAICGKDYEYASTGFNVQSGISFCGAQAYALGICALDLYGIIFCGAAASAFDACALREFAISACGGYACAFFGCAVEMYAADLEILNANAFYSCAVDLYGAFGCGINIYAGYLCGSNLGILSGCGINFNALTTCLIDACGVDACGVNASLFSYDGVRKCSVELSPINACAGYACNIDDSDDSLDSLCFIDGCTTRESIARSINCVGQLCYDNFCLAFLLPCAMDVHVGPCIHISYCTAIF